MVRLDLNVPLSKDGKTITSDKRLREVVPTLKFLHAQGAKTVVATHLGRPKPPGPFPDALKTKVLQQRLSELLDVDVRRGPEGESVGTAAAKACGDLSNGSILLLENVRFSPGEEKNDPAFAAALAQASHARLCVDA